MSGANEASGPDATGVTGVTGAAGVTGPTDVAGRAGAPGAGAGRGGTGGKTAVTPPTHAAPPARFSHGVRKGGILQVAGQVGFLPAAPGEPPAVAGPTLREQTRQTLANVEAVLTEAGATWDDVVMLRVYLTDVAHFAEMNEVYDAYLADVAVPPARTTVYVGLPQGLLVEIDALAVLD
ncbi:RidA family protein [Streptomyces fradiae ATCC 10745 = DSM 40063]|nr:RidA family protein [Streptomyces fradiae ATCC 10745 = DSM 40063]